VGRQGEEVSVRDIRVLRPRGWRLYSADEWMLAGAAPKNYLAFGDPDRSGAIGYIAKRPAHWGPRECVTEEIISRIGRLLPLRVAESRLVRLPPKPGASPEDDPDVRFLSRNFLRRGEELVHGQQLYAEFLGISQPQFVETFNLLDPKEEAKLYTVESAEDVLCWRGRTAECGAKLVESFARMLAFDAVVGSPDRHAENWGIIQDPKHPDGPVRFAPVYDTARGLLGTHAEDKLEMGSGRSGTPTRRDFLKKYALGSRPVFTCQRRPGERVSHFDLIGYIMSEERLARTMAGAVKQLVGAFSLEAVEADLEAQVGKIISPLRMELILELLALRIDMLKGIMSVSGGRRR